MICWTCGKANGHSDGSACAGGKTIPDPVGAHAQAATTAGSAR